MAHLDDRPLYCCLQIRSDFGILTFHLQQIFTAMSVLKRARNATFLSIKWKMAYQNSIELVNLVNLIKFKFKSCANNDILVSI